jgi:hypothetical protein
MLQVCLFGSHDGPLSPEKKCIFTLFGGCTLKRPTLARQMIAAQRVGEGKAPRPKMIFITLFGGTSIQCPTLAEEYIDMREAVRSGAINMERWDFYMAELDRWESSALMSLTLFGGFSETDIPDEDVEIEGLALQRHFNNLDEESGRILEMGVGQTGSHRRAVIQQAVMTE